MFPLSVCKLMWDKRKKLDETLFITVNTVPEYSTVHKNKPVLQSKQYQDDTFAIPCTAK